MAPPTSTSCKTRPLSSPSRLPVSLTAAVVLGAQYCTLRQRISRFVRKTLPFSKSVANHELVTRWFIIQYNFQRKASLTT
ncbi:MAG: IS1 family transposase [Chloroflexota bacterium]